MKRRGRGGSRGSASVVVLAGSAALLTVAVSATVVTLDIARRHQVESVADLAALAAAAVGPESGCRAAARVATAAGDALTGCFWRSGRAQLGAADQVGALVEVEVEVEVSAVTATGGHPALPVTARARAGRADLVTPATS